MGRTLREEPGILILRPAADPKRRHVTPQHRPDATAELTAALRERILVLDGAMGTMIQRDGLSEADYRGERFADWQRPAGQQRPAHADPARASSARSTASTSRPAPTSSRPTPSTRSAISLADYGMEDLAYEMNLASARLAREACDAMTERTPDRPRYVAGALGPTNRTASISPDVNDPGARNVTYDELVEAYLEQAARPGRRRRRPAAHRDDLRHPQRQGGDLRPRDALRGARPPLAGDHLRHHHRRLRPHPVRPGHRGVLELGPARPAARGRPQLRARRRARCGPTSPSCPGSPTCFVSCYPNAGLPNAFGEYDETPDADGRGRSASSPTAGLVNLVGGCCGTTPDAHRRDRRGRRRQARRATPAEVAPALRLSGLEPLTSPTSSLFVNVGERTNITGSARFRNLIKDGDYDTALSVARQQVEAGAQVIDVNMDEGMIDGVAAMDRFLKLIATEPDICRVPVMIDSSQVGGHRGRPQVRAGQADRQLDLHEGGRGEVPRARPAVPQVRRRRRRDGLRRGRPGRQPRAPQGRSASAPTGILVDEVGFPAEDIIFDPNIFAVATGIEEHANYGLDFIEATRWIKQNLPGALVSGGVSNVSFSLPRQQPGARGDPRGVPLPRHRGRAWTWASSTPARSSSTTRSTRSCASAIEDVVLNRRPDAAERLLEIAEEYRRRPARSAEVAAEEWRSLPVGERITHALVKGIDALRRGRHRGAARRDRRRAAAARSRSSRAR